jgi:nucleotide-binding universal stress UspA family protein
MNVTVPVDFSDHSINAAEFTGALVKLYGGDLHLVHVLVPIDDEPDYIPVKTLEAKCNTVYEISQLQELLRRKYGLRTSCELLPGEIAPQIMKAAHRTGTRLIVMGTQGNTGLKKYLYGSHTASVMDESDIPVLTLPEGASFRPFRKMVYATDYNYSNVNDLRTIARFAGMFDAEISIIHINKHNAASLSAATAREDFETLVRDNVGYTNITFEEYDNTDTAEGLRALLQHQYADLLAIPNRRKHLVEKITGRSAQEDFVFDLDIPLLVF